MKNGFVIATVLLILIIAFCVSGTVMSKEKTNPMKDDERYTAWEETFVKHIKSTLAGQGYPDSGITVNWIKRNGKRTYTVAVHHKRIGRLDQMKQELLRQMLLREKLADDDCKVLIELTD